MKLEDDAVGERRRWWIHLAMCVAFALMVLLISQIQQSSLLKTIFTASLLYLWATLRTLRFRALHTLGGT